MTRANIGLIQSCLLSAVCYPGLVYVTYYIDNNVTNPYQLWQSMGRPDYPSTEQFRRLRTVQVNNIVLVFLQCDFFFNSCP